MEKGEGLFQTKVNEQGHGKGCVLERAPEHQGMISEHTKDEPGPGHGAEAEEVGFMQNGAQEGYLDDDEIQPFVEEFEMRIRQIRGQDPRKARNLVHLVTNQVVRGQRSKLPSLRQVSRSLQAIVDNVWPELAPLVNVHADSHGSWTTKFWKRVRTACRKCSRAYRKRKVVLSEAKQTAEGEGQGNDVPVCEKDDSEELRENAGEEMDVVSTMQRTTPPWRREYRPRDKWLRHRDESPRRRRPEGHREWRRDRSPSRPRKGKSKGSRPSSSTSVRKFPTRVCARPDREEEPQDEESEVEVVVEDGPPSRMTPADAVQLWRRLIEFSPEGETGQPTGLPTYMIDNLRATAADMDAAEVHTMLAALVQLQALVAAQATEVLNERLQEIAAEGADESALMQGSMTIAAAEDGISTFGHWLQKASDALSEMGPKSARVCARLLQQELKHRYGSGGGRAMMGERVRGLEALAIAYLGEGCLPTTEPYEGDPAWVEHWWRRLLPALRSEEMAIAHSMLHPVEVDSQGSLEPTSPVSSASTSAMASSGLNTHHNEEDLSKDTAVDEDAVREVEEEDIRQVTRLQREWDEKQLRDYEQHLKEEEQADEWRLREYETMVAQDWDDWAMSSTLAPPEQMRKRQRLWAVLQVHDRYGAVTDKAEVYGDVSNLSDVTVTIGLQFAELPHGEDQQSPELSAAASSTESACKGGQGVHATRDDPKERVPRDLVGFLASEEGQRAFRFWNAGALTNRRLVQEYGAAVLDAFQTQRIAMDRL